jgi:predicted nucleotide-binding protein (sugar kinase/HSP70/actin superfamily)
MGAFVFGNELFDHWLNQKSLEILNKVEKEKISTEDMLILSLKAQTNHFHHMDQEFRGEFRKIEQNFAIMEEKFEKRFEQVEERFEQVDKRFDRIMTILMWQAGVLVTLISGIYLKLFLV